MGRDCKILAEIVPRTTRKTYASVRICCVVVSRPAVNADMDYIVMLPTEGEQDSTVPWRLPSKMYKVSSSEAVEGTSLELVARARATDQTGIGCTQRRRGLARWFEASVDDNQALLDVIVLILANIDPEPMPNDPSNQPNIWTRRWKRSGWILRIADSIFALLWRR